MITPAQTLGGVSEEGLLGSIFPFFTPQPGLLVGPGDDAAVVAASGPVVATTDAMVRGRDWLDQWSSASDVGAKLLTQNLADLAAFGEGATVDVAALRARGLIRGSGAPVKLLAEGDAPRNLVVRVDRASAAARAKVEAAGGTVEIGS
jgi:hypothetical protein